MIDIENQIENENGGDGAGTPFSQEEEARLARALADVAGDLRPVRARVLARLDALPAPRARPHGAGRSRPPLPLLGRRPGLLAALYATAAAALLVAYGAYLSLLGVQRQALAAAARSDVRNIAIVFRALRDRAPTDPGAPADASVTLAAALARLKLERDPFGNAYALAGSAGTGGPGRVYSFGANGRDERGGGDDIAAEVR